MKGSGILKRLKLLKEQDVDKIKLFTKLVRELKEPNIYLLERLVFFLPGELLYCILRETKSIIKNGGYPTEDSTRLKTPGGIFFTLVRNKIPKENAKIIWNIRRNKKIRNSRLRKICNDVQKTNDETMESEEEGILTEEAIITDDLCDMVI
ncbi:hypothetical protein FG386_002692 [Cryptosporidium ryanae]|uniref:uncharacterized protein n=1 Tax=Cryptosporidium ryanae TaxID=515981 RepID=UPI00351A3151|nr:hypothetical protein FG386_002692 [Cryptosporidium ryanae]